MILMLNLPVNLIYFRGQHWVDKYGLNVYSQKCFEF